MRLASLFSHEISLGLVWPSLKSSALAAAEVADCCFTALPLADCCFTALLLAECCFTALLLAECCFTALLLAECCFTALLLAECCFAALQLADCCFTPELARHSHTLQAPSTALQRPAALLHYCLLTDALLLYCLLTYTASALDNSAAAAELALDELCKVQLA